MKKTKWHMCVSCSGALKNPKRFRGCIEVDGKILLTEKEIKAFFQQEIAKGHRVIPCGDCDNFDYQIGCKGHAIEEDAQ